MTRFDGTNDNDKLPPPGEDNSGNDRFFGGRGNDRLRGGEGNDRIFGEEDRDKLFGEDGNDRLIGDDGNDKLRGDAGNDRLDGGAGKDVLTGGPGRDRFEITSDDRPDKILDYARGVDTLDLEPLLPNFGASGDVLDDFVQVTSSPSQTVISVDQSGTGTGFVPVARLQDVLSFDDPTPADFNLPAPGTPFLANPMEDQTAAEGQEFDFTVPANAFTDPDGDTLQFDFELTDGGNLPSWITEIRADGFSGTPRGQDQAEHDIRVTASDGNASAEGTFTLAVRVRPPGDDADDSSDPGGVSDFTRTSQNPAISFTGRFVAFDTTVNDEIELSRSQSVFVRDSVTEDRILVSPTLQVTDDGRLLNAAANPTISDTGRFVAYETFVDDAIPLDDISVDPDATRQIDIVDLTQPDVFTPVVRGNAPSFNPDISGDGTRVAFQSDASDLSNFDGNGSDIFLRDFLDDSMTLVSAGRSGDSTNPVISQDGSHVAFENGGDIFVNRISRGDPVRVEAPDGLDARSPDISGDGNRIVFEGVADNEIVQAVFVLTDPSDPGSTPQLVAQWDGTVVPGDGFSMSPSISADGRLVSYIAPNEIEVDVDGELTPVPVLELRVQRLSSSGEPQGDPDVVVRSSDLNSVGSTAITQAVLSGDGEFAGFVSSEQSFGGGLDNNDEGGAAVFSTPTDGFLQGQPLGGAPLSLAEVVDGDAEDVGVLIGAALTEDAPASQDPPETAPSEVNSGSTMSLDQVLAPAPDDVV